MKTIMAVLLMLLVLTALLLSAPTQAQEGYGYSAPAFREWTSATELRAWLKQDLTDEREYRVDVYDCENYAMDLAMAAARDGYYIGLRCYPVYPFKGVWEMDNFAVVGNHVYKINPQNDYCVRWGKLD